LRDASHPVTANFRGNERIYPASVVKLFYLAAAQRWLEDKRIEETPELTRALHDMIVDSSNEATQYVVDVITHTTAGYELPPKEMEDWQNQRNAVNRYFASLGYTNINVNQKTFCEDAYGRERVSRGPNGENRNKLTTDATARLLMEIVTGKAAPPARTTLMMDLLKRDYTVKTDDNDNQARGFTGIALQRCGRRRVFGPKLDGQAQRVMTRLTWRCPMVQSLYSLRSRQNTQMIGRLFQPLPGSSSMD
jgi:beta-lactamase class A